MEALPPEKPKRRTKFTDANLRQIVNLVERGVSPAEIAEIIGVTLGTLKTTCSKLQISLRRPSFNTGTGLLPRRCIGSEPPVTKTEMPHRTASNGANMMLVDKDAEVQQLAATKQCQSNAHNAGPFASLAVVMQYKGQTLSAALPLNFDVIGQLAIEAEFRGINLVQLIAQSIEALAKGDYFDLVLGSCPQRTREQHR